MHRIGWANGEFFVADCRGSADFILFGFVVFFIVLGRCSHL